MANVLPLSKTNHPAFDCELSTLGQDYRLHVNPAFETESLKQQNDGKYVIMLSEVVKLEDAIPFAEGEANVRGMTYTTLRNLKEVTTIDDL